MIGTITTSIIRNQRQSFEVVAQWLFYLKTIEKWVYLNRGQCKCVQFWLTSLYRLKYYHRAKPNKQSYYTFIFLQCDFDAKKPDIIWIDGRRLFRMKNSHRPVTISLITSPLPFIRFCCMLHHWIKKSLLNTTI